MKVKDALKGIVLALVAAYFFPIFFNLLFEKQALSTQLSDPKGLFLLYPLIGLLATYWLVIPIGAGLGILIPKVAHRHSRQTAMFYGLLLGALVGIAGSITLSLFKILPGVRDGYWSSLAYILLAMSLYSAVWVGAYSYLCGKKSVTDSIS